MTKIGRCYAGMTLLAALLTLGPAQGAPAQGTPAPMRAAMSTEEFLNHLGVNTHLNGLTQADPWNTNAAQVGEQFRYLGVRLDRDWAHSAVEGRAWKAVQKAWGPQGRLWTSIDEASPADQRQDLADEEAIATDFPGLVYALGGPNEEDDSYPQGQHATLPDSALVQQELFHWAHTDGRNFPVSQMEFGAGWTAANGWQGDYNPHDTGLYQNYTPGPADFGAAHTYLHQPGQRPGDVLAQIRALAKLATPGKPVAQTEFGAYRSAALSAAVYGQDVVMGALDSAAAGDSAFLVYGLQDSGPENTYGFFTYPGGIAHPAAVDVHTLTTILASPSAVSAPGQKSTFHPGSLDVSLSDPTVSHLLLQKPGGAFVLALWSEQSMDGLEHDVTETLQFTQFHTHVQIYDVETGKTPLVVLAHIRQFYLAMRPSDTYLVVVSDKP